MVHFLNINFLPSSTRYLQAFIHELPFLRHHMFKQRDCSLKIYGEPIQQGDYSLSVPKYSPWKQVLSQAILKLKEQEVISELYKKWFPASCSQNTTGNVNYSSLKVNYFGGLIFILGLCLVVSLALLGIEHFCFRHRSRVINPIQDKVQIWRESKIAGRRNALIDPEDISRLQKLQAQKIQSVDESDDNDSLSCISEREEELILARMRSGRMSESIAVRRDLDGNVPSKDLFTIGTAFEASDFNIQISPKHDQGSNEENNYYGDNNYDGDNKYDVKSNIDSETDPEGYIIYVEDNKYDNDNDSGRDNKYDGDNNHDGDSICDGDNNYDEDKHYDKNSNNNGDNNNCRNNKTCEHEISHSKDDGSNIIINGSVEIEVVGNKELQVSESTSIISICSNGKDTPIIHIFQSEA